MGISIVLIGILCVLLLCTTITIVIFSIMKAMSKRRKKNLDTSPNVPDNSVPFMNMVSDNIILMCLVHFH